MSIFGGMSPGYFDWGDVFPQSPRFRRPCVKPPYGASRDRVTEWGLAVVWRSVAVIQPPPPQYVLILHLFALLTEQSSITNRPPNWTTVIHHNPSTVRRTDRPISKTEWTEIGQSAYHFVIEHNIRHGQNLSSEFHKFSTQCISNDRLRKPIGVEHQLWPFEDNVRQSSKRNMCVTLNASDA